MYKYHNANKYKYHINDCSIRAISVATGRTWDDVYDELSNEARQMGLMMDSVEFIEQYLDDRYERTCHYSKTVDEFIEEFPQGLYLISMPGHLSCVIDGVNVDTFDTSNRRMWCAWFVSE